MKYNNYTQSDLYCTRCGRRGIPIQRQQNKNKEAGHLKKLWCIECQKEINHAECAANSKYTYEDFKMEFEYGNFSEAGERILTYRQFKQEVKNGRVEKKKSLDSLRNTWDW